MSQHRFLVCFALVVASSQAFALPDFWQLFERVYQPAPGSAISVAQCVTCHTDKGQTTRNPFGKAVEGQLDANKASELTEAMLHQLSALDSDGDGVANGREISGGTLPGDPASTPGKAAAPEEPELIPKHSFHPTVVHFPIALFLFGAALDYFGARRGRHDLRTGAFVAMCVGALSSLLAVPTGILAWLRLGFVLEGTMLFHLLLGIAASVMMLSVSAWRRRGELDSTGYWLMLGISAVLVSVAGHFGAMMVFG